MVSKGAVFSETFSAQVGEITRVYRERQSILTLMRQLNRLISAIQIHRGVSLAHLAGDGLFTDDVTQIQAQINHRWQVFRLSVDGFETLISPQEQQNIQHSWNMVSHDWEGDALLENFEYHSFLIDQLLQISGGLGRELESPLDSHNAAQNTSAHEESVLGLVCRKIPELIEYLARVRGLATHSAVVGRCDDEHQKKLRYWVQCVERQSRGLTQGEALHESLEKTLKLDWPSFSVFRDYELKLAFFLNTVNKDIVGARGKKADARQLFSLASEIIEVYVEGVDGGISLLQSTLEAELEAWLVSA